MKKNLAFALIVLSMTLSSPGMGAAEPAPSKRGKEPSMTKSDLFQKIEALKELKAFTPDSVSKALDMPLEFDDTSAESTNSEAHGQAGAAIESVNIRGEGLRFLTLSVSSGLGVTMEEIRGRFGDPARVGRPVSHGRSRGPLYLIYPLKSQEMKFAVSLEKPNLLQRVILDRTDSALDEMKANKPKEEKK
jgi:hypothetical protein